MQKILKRRKKKKIRLKTFILLQLKYSIIKKKERKYFQRKIVLEFFCLKNNIKIIFSLTITFVKISYTLFLKTF